MLTEVTAASTGIHHGKQARADGARSLKVGTVSPGCGDRATGSLPSQSFRIHPPLQVLSTG